MSELDYILDIYDVIKNHVVLMLNAAQKLDIWRGDCEVSDAHVRTTLKGLLAEKTGC